jgi:hypothetical protein
MRLIFDRHEFAYIAGGKRISGGFAVWQNGWESHARGPHRRSDIDKNVAL